MHYNIIDNKIVIRKNGKAAQFYLSKLGELLNSSILEHLELFDLITLWKNLYGIPLNIKKYLERKVQLNDKSENINSFIFKDKTYWFDKNTRASLLALASCSEDTITFVLGDELVELEVSKARKFLSDLEVYASKCFVSTAKHFKAIKELKTLEDIINYDYTTGYPNKLKFDEYLDLA